MPCHPPLISIVVPTYNGNAYLKEAIASALSQTYRNIEIVVSDDGSQQNTAALVERFNDNRISFSRNEVNLGLTANLNRAIAVSRGDYICWLNQDDVFYPRKLERQLQVLQQNHHIGACFCEKDDIDAAGRRLQRFNPSRERIPLENQLLQLFGGCYLTASSVMMPRSVFAKIGMFNNCFQIAFDYDMWFRLRQHHEFHIIDQPLMAFRHHANNLSAETNSHVVGLEAAAIVSSALRNLDLEKVFPALKRIEDEHKHRCESASCYLVLARLIWSQKSWSQLLVADILALTAEAIRINPELIGAYTLAIEISQCTENTVAEKEYQKKWQLKCAEYQKTVARLRSPVREGDRKSIADLTETLIRMTPASGDPYYQLACLQAECGQPERARDNCRRALAVNPEHESAVRLLADMKPPGAAAVGWRFHSNRESERSGFISEQTDAATRSKKARAGRGDQKNRCADAPLYLGLVEGKNYGWGVCSRYLISELSRKVRCHVLNSADGTDRNPALGGKLFQALTGIDFFPMFENARGRENYGYTFFENELTQKSVENARKYDLVLAGSSWCRDRLLEKGIENCSVLIQGIDPQYYHPITAPRRAEDFVIFSGGKFELRKGQDLVLKAVKILQQKYDDLILVNCWYNIWPESMKWMVHSRHIEFEYKALPWSELMQTVYRANGLDSGRIRTFELVPNELQRSLFQQTDLGVFPNRCEGGTNLVMMEYMACAKPVVAANTSGHTDIVTAENALLLDQLAAYNIAGPDNKLIARWQEPSIDELVAQIEYAYHHRERIEALGRRAGADLKAFTWEKSAGQLLGFLNVAV